VSATTVLLVSCDGSLVKTMGEVVASVNDCRLENIRRVKDALEHLPRGEVDLVLFHLVDAGEARAATRLLHAAAKRRSPVPLVVVSEIDDPDLVLKMLQRGAVSCVCRPLDLSRLAFLVDVLTVRAREEQVRTAEAQDPDPQTYRAAHGEFLSAGPLMNGLMEQVERVAPLDTSIVLTGETGTGKTHLARTIHGRSSRKTEPFLVIDCGSLSSSLLESELFGHVRGAFTNADRNRVGKLAEVQNGTLLLDDVDCLPLAAQARLLRAVDERVFEPVGSNRSQEFSARLIVATNRSLEEDVAAGRFRRDLYYRLNVVGFQLPPLRERHELIRPLAEKFLAEFSSRNGRWVRKLSAAALDALARYQWPGNIRELRNVVERSVALCAEQTIDVDDLPAPISQDYNFSGQPCEVAPRAARNGLARARMNAESNRLSEVLCRHNNNRTAAAMELGISRVTLYKKLHRFGLI